MYKQTAFVCCVLLVVGAANAYPGSPSWRRAESDRDVEVVEPVRGGGGSYSPMTPDSSEESAGVIPFGIGIGIRGRPVFAIRPLAPRDSDEDSSDSSDVPAAAYGPTGFLYPSFADPMSSFVTQMNEMMAAMRRRMYQLMNRLPNEDSDISKLGNTTSTTKVVDGHVITVNETIIDGGAGDDSVVHIRVIDVHPSESPESAEGVGATTDDSGDKKVDVDNDSAAGSSNNKDVETVDGSDEATRRPNRAENEIPMKRRSARSTRFARSSTRRRSAPSAPRQRGDIASTGGADDDDDVQQYQMPVFPSDDEQDTQQSQVPVFDVQQRQQPVYNLQRRQQPVYNLQQQQQPVYNLQQQQQQQGQLRMLPANNNQVDVFDKQERRPDLSRDTRINVLLEQQHNRAGLIMVDPDAELMDIRDGKVVGVYNPSARQTRRTARAGSSW